MQVRMKQRAKHDSEQACFCARNDPESRESDVEKDFNSQHEEHQRNQRKAGQEGVGEMGTSSITHGHYRYASVACERGSQQNKYSVRAKRATIKHHWL